MSTHETEELTPRQELAVERITSDESLTGDLTDVPAKALINWATAKVAVAAGDTSLSDEQVGAYGTAVRKAVRAAIMAGHQSPEQLVASAEAALAPTTTNQSTAAGSLAPVAQAAIVVPEGPTHPPQDACSASSATIGVEPKQPRSWIERWRGWLQKERKHGHSQEN